MTLPTDALRVVEFSNRRYVFVSWGVIVYDLAWREVSRSRLANVVCGCVDATGIWFGTSSAGVWWLPLGGSGDTTGRESRRFGTDTVQTIQSDGVNWLDIYDGDLVVATDAGVDFITDSGGSVYQYADASGVACCAINSTNIVYAPSAGGVEYLAHPSDDWDTSDATALTTGSSPAIVNNTVQAVAYGTDLFIGTAGGVSVYDGSSVTNFTTTPLGTVVDVKAIHPQTDATDSAGAFAYATSNGSDGGRFGVYDIAGASNLDTVSGDATSAWLADDIGDAVYNDTVEQYAKIAPVSPGYGGNGVSTSYSIYAEIVDTLDDVASGSVVLKINGTTVSPTVTAITDGYKVEYSGSAGYNQRMAVELSATDDSADNNPISRSWWFVTEAAQDPAPVAGALPNIVAVRDISLAAAEADETIGTIHVIWGDEYTSALIATDAQAEAVAMVELDKTTFHKKVRTLKVKPTDAGALDTGELQQGDTVAVTCAALSMSAATCEVLAISATENISDGLEYILTVAEYEAV